MAIDIDTQTNEIIIRQPAKLVKTVPVHGMQDASVRMYRYGNRYYVGRVLHPSYPRAQFWNEARNRQEADQMLADLAQCPK